MGLAVGVDLAEEFDSEELEDIRTVRVESEYGFGGYGVAAVGGDDALGIQPDTRSTWWQTMPPDDWDVVEPTSHLILFNPQATAVDVVIDGGSPIELPAHSTTAVADFRASRWRSPPTRRSWWSRPTPRPTAAA